MLPASAPTFDPLGPTHGGEAFAETVLVLGVAEAVGPFTASAILTAFQVMLWSAARRSAASAQRRQ